jgi:hypothetical protein
MGEPAFEMDPNYFDEVKTMLYETAMFSWEVVGYVYKYIDENDFKFELRERIMYWIKWTNTLSYLSFIPIPSMPWEPSCIS